MAKKETNSVEEQKTPFSFVEEATKANQEEPKDMADILGEVHEFKDTEYSPEESVERTLMLMESLRKYLFSLKGLAYNKEMRGYVVSRLLKVYGNIRGSARVLPISDMVDPHNWPSFVTITPREFEELSMQAYKILKSEDDVPESITENCKNILQGDLPFGWTIYKGYYEGEVSQKLITLFEVIASEDDDYPVYVVDSKGIMEKDKSEFFNKYAKDGAFIDEVLRQGGISWDPQRRYPDINFWGCSLENIFFNETDATRRMGFLRRMEKEIKALEKQQAKDKEKALKEAEKEKDEATDTPQSEAEPSGKEPDVSDTPIVKDEEHKEEE